MVGSFPLPRVKEPVFNRRGNLPEEEKTVEKVLTSIDQIADRHQREVVIPDGYTVIGTGAFSGCSSLLYIVISESVTEIGEGAFHGCKALVDVVISGSIDKIGRAVFRECTSLEMVSITDSPQQAG